MHPACIQCLDLLRSKKAKLDGMAWHRSIFAKVPGNTCRLVAAHECGHAGAADARTPLSVLRQRNMCYVHSPQPHRRGRGWHSIHQLPPKPSWQLPLPARWHCIASLTRRHVRGFVGASWEAPSKIAGGNNGHALTAQHVPVLAGATGPSGRRSAELFCHHCEHPLPAEGIQAPRAALPRAPLATAACCAQERRGRQRFVCTRPTE